MQPSGSARTPWLQLAWAKSDSAGPTPDRRKADMRIDNAWGMLLDRLEAYSLLPAANHPRATRARELVDTISPRDREWLKLAYEAEWAESTKRLKRIEDEGLAKDINETVAVAGLPIQGVQSCLLGRRRRAPRLRSMRCARSMSGPSVSAAAPTAAPDL